MLHKFVRTEAGTCCLVAALALVPALVKLLCYPHNIGSDDAYIHLRIATNFAHGLGWGINPHESVNLSTSPAFTFLLAAAVLLTQHAIGLTQLLSGAAVVLGLLLIFLVARAETGSVGAALFAEAVAAFSVNLWRWNGALMEATFAFAVVAFLLYLLRSDAPDTPLRMVGAGLVLGVGMLLRPEMGLLAVLAMALQWLRSRLATRLVNQALLLFGVVVVLAPWCVFARRQMGSAIPTTFAAKSTTHLILLNGHIVQQFGESIVESMLFPTLLVLLLVGLAAAAHVGESRAAGMPALDDSMAAARGSVTAPAPAPSAAPWTTYILPVGWVFGLFAFYYLKTPGLQSTGRYVLPLLPCEVLLLALVWTRFAIRPPRPQQRLTGAFVALHIVFAVALNYIFVMPVLRRFQSEYVVAMRAAADELALRVHAGSNPRVLVEEDIGVLSCEANGRFEIYDGGALATPALRGLSIRSQIDRVQPAYVLQSLATSPAGFGASYSDLLSQLWERRFRQHSIRRAEPFYYAIIYKSRESPTQLAGR